MKPIRVVLYLVLIAAAVLLPSPRARAQSSLIAAGSVWRYHNLNQDLGTTWTNLTFSDASWASGAGPLGSNNLPVTTTINIVGAGGNRIPTIYFRRVINVPTPGAYTGLLLRLQKDDGAVVYINGVEAVRAGMPDPPTPILFSTLATFTADDANEPIYNPFSVPTSLLVPGQNIVAVEVHQVNLTSSDLQFDLELLGVVPPTAAITNPVDGAIVMLPATVPVHATASDADGTVATVDFYSNGTYVGSDATPPYSAVLSNLVEGDLTLTAVATDNTSLSSTSAPVNITLVDTNPPSIVTLQAQTNSLTVIFSKRVAPPGATQLANYMINNGISVLGAAYGSSSNVIVLATSYIAPGVTNRLTVNNVQDFVGNTIAAGTEVAFTVTGFSSTDVGLPLLGGSTLGVPGGYDITGAGTNMSGNADQFQFNYRQFAGDFDVKVRVQALSLSDAWAKAGLIARETLAAGSRYAGAFATPTVSGCFLQYRGTNNGATFNSGGSPATFPNTWLRLQRVGNTFNGYAGVDGAFWTRLGSISITLPNSVLLGMAVTSASSNRTTTAEYRDYMDVTGSPTVGGLTLPFEPPGPSSRKTGLAITEIHYHPTAVPTNHSLEFIEFFNSQAFFEDLSGYRITGDINYTFPNGTRLAAGSYLVLARDPAFVQSFYGISGVMGPWDGTQTNAPGVSTNGLSAGGGTIRLRNEGDGVTLEINYQDRKPWPIAADGAGHSLVLARASYGEGDARAWAASDGVNGTPGRAEPYSADPQRNVVINEFLAGSAGETDFVELYNHSNQEVDLSGCWLTDDPDRTNQFRIPNGTRLSARGRQTFFEAQLGFGLSSSGERIFLINSNRTCVLDAIEFEGQAQGVSSGRFPDGSPEIRELAALTPDDPNAVPLLRAVAINEIMYAPISGDRDDEYVELYNRGPAVNLGGWRFTDGFDFEFPANTVLTSNSYLVVCRDVVRLRSRYPNLTAANSIGNFDGNLDNGGERIALSMPQVVPMTNLDQTVTLVTNYIVVNEVTYADGGRWSSWADGGGSSLELVDPRSDNRQPANWADSNESAKSTNWTSFEISGPLDNGQAPNADPINGNLQVSLLGIGECLVDDIEVRTTNNVNTLGTSGNFEAGVAGWTLQGSHDMSSLEEAGYQSDRSLHIRAASRGDNGANKVRSPALSPIPTGGATLRGKARWLRGWPEILLRLHGGTLEVSAMLTVPANLGSPGAPNSRLVPNAGPAIWAASHAPVLPQLGEPVVVTARAWDPDGLSVLRVRHRVDAAAPPVFGMLTMVDDGTGGDAVAGDGLYSATLPLQATPVMVGFYLEAVDGQGRTNTFPQNMFASGGLPRLFPLDSPSRECLVRWGERQMPGSFATYHLWTTAATSNRWTIQPPAAGARDNLNNANMDCTFAYNNYRVVYNVHTRFAGSPWHRGQMTTGPSGSNRNDYDLVFPEDDRLLGASDFVVGTPGNPQSADATDTSCQSEQTSYLIFKEVGVHYNHRRYVHMFLNGVQRSITANRAGNFLMEDCQQPNGDVIEEWHPDDTDGTFFKIEDWFEFNDAATAFNNNDADLERRMTTNMGSGVLDLAPYRFMWRPRSVSAGNSASDYSEFMKVVDIASPVATPTATTIPDWQALNAIVDLDQWMKIMAVQHTIGNWDSYGYDRGKNCYSYKPENGRFQLYTWDIDFTMGIGGNGATTQVFGCNDPRVVAMWNTPEIRRIYLRAFQRILDQVLSNPLLDPILDAKSAAFAANGINYDPNNTTTIKNFIRDRRNYLLNTVVTNTGNFAFNVATPTPLTVTSNLLTVSGVAPISIGSITATIGGKTLTVPFSSATAWSFRTVVAPGNTEIVFQVYDPSGVEVTSLRRTNVVTYNGTEVDPREALVINEIMYNHPNSGANYIELINRTANVTFDLSGWRLDGVEYTFPKNTFFLGGTRLLLVKNRSTFGTLFATNAVFVFDAFDGTMNPLGETLSLVRPGATPAEDVYIDRVRYEPQAPWSASANGQGGALQLVDASVDNARASAWGDGSGWRYVEFRGTAQTNGTNFLLWLQQAGDVYVDDVELVVGTNVADGPNLLQNADFEQPLEGFWTLGTSFTNSHRATNVVRSGTGSLHIVGTGAGNQNNAVRQLIEGAVPPATNYALAYWYRTSLAGTNLTVRIFPGSGLNTVTFVRPQATSPGLTNPTSGVLPPYPLVWLNEVQPQNVSGPMDRFGTRSPWVELYNSDTNVLLLEDYYLAASYGDPLQWRFPAGAMIQPGQHLLVWADGQPGLSNPTEWHTSFTLSPSNGSVALVRVLGSDPQVMDHLNYSGVGPNQSYGDNPDGQPFDRVVFNTATPGSANYAPPITVYINEWVAANQAGPGSLVDPTDGDYDDWFELYNPGAELVNLGGYYLTDNLLNRTQWRIPDGTVVPGGGYRLVWADGETGQNGTGTNGDLHANFNLSRNGEAIGLYAVVGTNVVLIDAVTFGEQLNNVSQGRYPDGTATLPFMTPPTPRGPNQPGNLAPTLNPISDRTVTVGTLVSFDLTAVDNDVPAQMLTFTMTNAPGGAMLTPAGHFTWTPGLEQSPSTNRITARVTDNGVPAVTTSQQFTIFVVGGPHVTISAPVGNQVTLSFATVAGKHYRIESTEELQGNPANTVWTTVEDNILATGPSLSVMDTLVVPGQLFYRVVQLD